MGDFGGLFQHGGGRAVFFDRKFDGAGDLGGVDGAALDDEMQVDAGEDLGRVFCTVGFKLDKNVIDVLAPFFEDRHHIVGRTCACAHQNQFHGRGPGLRCISVRRADHDGMARFGLAGESLLDTYEQERKPIAATNCQESLENYHKILDVISAFDLDVEGLEKLAKFKNSIPIRWFPIGFTNWIISLINQILNKKFDKFYSDAKLKEKVLQTIEDQIPHFDRIGLDIGYIYGGGALISYENDPENKSTITEYVPSAQAGARLPHFSFDRSEFPRSSHDLLGYNKFTLLICENSESWIEAVQNLSEEIQSHIQVKRLDQLGISTEKLDEFIELLEINKSGSLLVRPDDHVAIRIKEMPADPLEVLKWAFDQILFRKETIKE